MSDFLLAILKGMYPVYLLLAVAGIILHIRRRQWRGADTVLVIAFLFIEIVTIAMTACSQQEYVTFKRYLWIAIPIYLPFAAAGVTGIRDYFARKKLLNCVLGLICAAIVGASVYNTLLPVFRERFSAKKRSERAVSIAVGSWIREDWNSRPTAPIRHFRCDYYQSGKRPLIQSEYKRIGWFCGGQLYPEFLAAYGIAPDYVVSPVRRNFPGYVLVRSFPQAHVYKNIRHLP